MRLDGAVRGRVRNASQHKAVTGLVVVQEGLVGLVDGTRDNLTRARRARARSAGVRQVNASFFSRVENVGVVRAFNLLGAFRGFQSDREVHDGHASLHFHGARLHRDGFADEGGLLDVSGSEHGV